MAHSSLSLLIQKIFGSPNLSFHVLPSPIITCIIL
jgi:hypothetical protein